MATGAWARGFVDEFDAFMFQPGEGFRKVRYPVGDVMETLAPFLKEASNSRFRIQGFQELDRAHEEHANALFRELLDGGTGVSGYELEQGSSLLQGGHGYGDVVERIGKHDFYGAWVRAFGTPDGA